MAETLIEWATHSDNYQSGCTKKSPACLNCYAIPQSARIERMGGPARYKGVAVVTAGKAPRWTGIIQADLEAMYRIFSGLEQARKPRRVFLNSMTDTFHDDVPDEVLAALATCLRMKIERHVVMLLTKRADRLLAWQRAYFPDGLPPYVWVGCTVEDQKRADERVPLLVQVLAQVRFLSVEPLLEPVDLTELPAHYADDDCPEGARRPLLALDALRGGFWVSRAHLRGSTGSGAEEENAHPTVRWLGEFGPSTGRIGWVLCGDESGPGRRDTDVAWVRALRDQCERAGTPFFLKQLHRDGKKLSLPELDGRTWADVPGATS